MHSFKFFEIEDKHLFSSTDQYLAPQEIFLDFGSEDPDPAQRIWYAEHWFGKHMKMKPDPDQNVPVWQHMQNEVLTARTKTKSLQTKQRILEIINENKYLLKVLKAFFRLVNSKNSL